jgi:hypothetical protein
MNRRDIFGLSAIAALGLALLPGSAVSQQKSFKEQIVGLDARSALDVKPDGTKSDRWGPNAKGIFIFDANGRFAQFITRSPSLRPRRWTRAQRRKTKRPGGICRRVRHLIDYRGCLAERFGGALKSGSPPGGWRARIRYRLS